MSGKDGADSRDIVYSRLSTQELEEMLRFAAFSDGELDMEHVERLLAELKRRETKSLAHSPEEALEIFKEEYSEKHSSYLDCAYQPHEQAYHSRQPEQAHRRRLLPRATLVAAIMVAIMLMSMIAVQAAGIDVFGAIARWTSEVFSFSANNIETLPNSNPDAQSANDDYETIEDVLKAYSIERRITPTWIPNGYEQMDFEVSELSTKVNVYATYRVEESFLMIKISLTDSPTSVFEKTDAEVHILSIDGVDYYLMENTSTYQVIWYVEGCECLISGNVSTDVLVQMIESIYMNEG